MLGRQQWQREAAPLQVVWMSRTPVRAPAAGKQTAALAGEPRAPGEAVRYLRSCKCKALLFSKDAKHAKQTVSALMAQQSSWAPEQAEGKTDRHRNHQSRERCRCVALRRSTSAGDTILHKQAKKEAIPACLSAI